MNGWRLVRARGEAVPASVHRFALRARQRRVRAAIPWLVALGIVGFLAMTWLVISHTRVLGVAHIQVTGETIVTADDVRAAAKVPRGTPLVTVDVDAVESRVEKLAAIRTATVIRDWPCGLVIRITERQAVAVIPVEDGREFLAIDITGTAFHVMAQRPEGLPLVRLVSPSPSDPTTRSAMTVLRSLPPELRQRLAVLVAEAPARIRLELNNGKTIIWGDSTESDTKARIALVFLEKPGKILDVSAPSLVTVR